MRRTAAFLLIPASLMLAASPAYADQAVTKPAESGAIEPDYNGDVFVNFTRAVVNGEDVYRIPRDVPVTLFLDIYNPNEDAVTNIRLDLNNRPEEIRWTKGNATVDRLEGFESAQVEVEIMIPSRAECLDDDSAEGTITSSRGTTPTTLWLPVGCPGPRLYQSMIEYKGGDGDDVPEAGERLEVWISYGNWGVDPATNVRGTLTIDNEHVRVIEGSAAWPTIRPADPKAQESETGTKQLTPFIIEIDADAPVSDGGCGWDGGPGPIIIDDAPASDEAPPSDGGGTDGSTGTEPADGGAVSSDGTTSSDGGSNSGATTTTVEPSKTEPDAGDEPVSSQDAPMSPEEEARYEQPDPSVAFEGKLHLVAAETEMNEVVGGTMNVCMYASSDANGGGAVLEDDARQLGAPETTGVGADVLAAAGSEDAAGTGSSALAAAFLAGIATAAWFVMRRRLLTR